MKKLLLIAVCAALAACGQREEAAPAEEANIAVAEPDANVAAPAEVSLAETTWDYTMDGKPKLALRAFRFPFVAFRQKSSGIRYWGRTPAGVNKAVVVEQAQGSRWTRLVAPKVDRYGIFQGRVSNVRGNGPLRARLLDRSDRSQPFTLNVPADFRFCPWGSFC